MTKVRLLNGPCDPRDVEMSVLLDADRIEVRPMPFQLYDVYTVTDRFVDDGTVVAATGEYLCTRGTRPQIEAYRRQLARVSGDRAFRVKRKQRDQVH